MRKLMLLLLLLALPLFAQAEGLTISPTEEGFAYDFTLTDEWVRLHYKGPNEKGIKSLYTPGGHFMGEIETRCGEGGKYTVTLTRSSGKWKVTGIKQIGIIIEPDAAEPTPIPED